MDRADPPSPRIADELVEVLSRKVVGQSAAMESIVPYVLMYQAGLAPEGRPVGVFLLLGPTGTGKTRTVEALAETLHGSERNLLKIDCGEFQMEHEVAKLIGAPPGYLGHRETVPMIGQKRLAGVTSDRCDLSLVLFDEIEKAAPSLARLLLGVLDKATLRLGDNTTVNFEKSLVFLTSNLGAREMMRELNAPFGFAAGRGRDRAELSNRLEGIALAAVRKRFSPEFVNRIDAVITYRALDTEALAVILDQQLEDLQRHVTTRLGPGCFAIEVSADSRRFLLQKGTSPEYGARELRRTVHRHLTQPLAALVATGRVDPGARVRVELADGGERLAIHVEAPPPAPAGPGPGLVLVVDDNAELLAFLGKLVAGAGWHELTAESAAEARERLRGQPVPGVALLDYLLPDQSGIELGVALRDQVPDLPVIIMTGLHLPADEEARCEAHGFEVLRKPFRSSEVIGLLRGRLAGRIASSTP